MIWRFKISLGNNGHVGIFQMLNVLGFKLFFQNFRQDDD